MSAKSQVRAFPFEEIRGRSGGYVSDWTNHPGMSLRDYLAARAMQGWLSTWGESDGAVKPEKVAAFAYEMADAMLRARESQS